MGPIDSEAKTIAYLAVPVVFLGICLLGSIIFNLSSFVKLHQHRDGARYAVPWLKASGVLITIFIIFWLTFDAIQWGWYNGAYLNSMATHQVNNFWALFKPVALGALIVTQVELVIGLRYASSLSQGKATAPSVRTPRAFSRMGYLLLVILSLGRFVYLEYTTVALIDSPTPYRSYRALSMTLFALLLVQAFGSLIYAVGATRGTSLESMRSRLVAMCSITVVRQLYVVVVMSVGYAKPRLMYETNFAWIIIPDVILVAGTALICLALGYSMAAKRYGGLWADNRPPSEVDA